MYLVWMLPEGDRDLGARIGAINARLTWTLRRAGFSPPSTLPIVRYGRFTVLKPGLRNGKRESAVWQRRFCEHHIRNEDEFRAYVDYCHINPVKHGFVERPADWAYSTVHLRGM